MVEENGNNLHHFRKNIQLHCEVAIVLKKDQKTGKRTIGFVRWILTSKAYHSNGIKVMLHNKMIGRVVEIFDKKLQIEELIELQKKFIDKKELN
jgi:uncharacterized repeat protein (TIGR03833 family)